MTNYEKIMENMSVETLANLTCKLVTVNNNTIFYLTSTGQLFPPSDLKAALEFEKNWLNSESLEK